MLVPPRSKHEALRKAPQRLCKAGSHAIRGSRPETHPVQGLPARHHPLSSGPGPATARQAVLSYWIRLKDINLSQRWLAKISRTVPVRERVTMLCVRAPLA